MAAIGRIREVWQKNIMDEFNLIRESLKASRLVSMDTEFPGTVITNDLQKHDFNTLSPAQHYFLMKENVNALEIIQIGLTLSDDMGNTTTWQFNFRDFNVATDRHNPKSIELLHNHGINFNKNKRKGIASRVFAEFFKRSGLGSGRAWVTFHGISDFGFLIKILSGAPLPDDLNDFMMLMRHFLGRQVYDLKSIGRDFGLLGGLEKVARSLCLERAAGLNHQAGSDSLLTMQAFLRLLAWSAPAWTVPRFMVHFNYKLYGLTTPHHQSLIVVQNIVHHHFNHKLYGLRPRPQSLIVQNHF